MTEINQLIRCLHLEPLPIEGGHFCQTWVSQDFVSITRYAAQRSAGSGIYYLLTSEPDSFSAMHRLATDEIYHFYLGDPVEMLLLDEKEGAQRIIFGPDILAGQHVQYVVKRSVWQGSRVIAGGRFALLGTTMAPGFDPRDFTLGSRDDLARQFPDQAALISQLTRS